MDINKNGPLLATRRHRRSSNSKSFRMNMGASLIQSPSSDPAQLELRNERDGIPRLWQSGGRCLNIGIVSALI